MNKKYVVELTSEERSELQAIVKKGKAAAYKIKHAHILLNADQGPEGPQWTDADIAKTFHCHVTTVENVRRRLVEHGLEAAIERAKHIKPTSPGNWMAEQKPGWWRWRAARLLKAETNGHYGCWRTKWWS